MLPEIRLLYDEILGILKAQFECTESLQATSMEVQSLLDAEKFQQVQERLVSRGEVIDLMVSLDQQLTELLLRVDVEKADEKWNEVLFLADRIRKLMTTIMSMDSVSQTKMRQSCQLIQKKLDELQRGKKVSRRYVQHFNEGHRSSYRA